MSAFETLSLPDIKKALEQVEARITLVKEQIRKVKTLPKSKMRKEKLNQLNHIRQTWEKTQAKLTQDAQVASATEGE